MIEGKVAVLSGGKSDQPVAEDAISVLAEQGVRYDARMLSSHRNRKELEAYVGSSDADVFIAVAGLAAHLPGFIASITNKPVIGVPVSVKLGGLDALLSIVQMPPGVPVACVGVDNGKNAAHLAIRILSLRSKDTS